MKARRLQAGLLLALVFGLLPRPVHAQPAGASGAPTDSLGRPIFGFLRPTYTSSYNITQNETAWNQGFAFRNQFGQVSFDSDTQYTINTNPKRTNFRRTGGTTTNRLDYPLFDRIPLSATLSYDRKGTDDANDRQRQERLETGLTATYRKKFARLLDVNMNGGYSVTRSSDIATFQGLETGAREKGLNRNLGLNATLTPTRGMTFRLNSAQTLARTRSTPVSDTTGVEGDPKSNTNTSHALSAAWNLMEGLDATTDWQWRSSSDSYILVDRNVNLNNRVETVTTRGNSLTSALRYKPQSSPTSELSLEFGRRSDANDRAVQRDRSTDRSSSNGKVKVRRMFFNTQFESNFALDRSQDRSPSRPGSVTINRNLDGTLTRTMSEQTTVRAIGEIGIRSLRFDLGDLDADAQKKRVEAAVIWKPSQRLQATVGGRSGRDLTVNVDSTQSRGTRLDENFGVNADVKLAVTTRTRVSQTYNFTALFSSFRFKPESDNIQRTREIKTSISHQLLKKVALELNHGFKYRETGGYRRDARGTRIFAKGENRYDQDLRVAVNYQPAQWLGFRTEEWFHRDDTIRLVNNARKIYSRIEFNQTANLTRNIPGGGTLTASGGLQVRQPVEPPGGARESYINATISLSKPF